jgi:hypothetical protein
MGLSGPRYATRLALPMPERPTRSPVRAGEQKAPGGRNDSSQTGSLGAELESTLAVKRLGSCCSLAGLAEFKIPNAPAVKKEAEEEWER